MAERHIVIVGGGFTGTALAIHLARHGYQGLKVTLIEPRENPGQGVAYGSVDPAHRINVPAARMYLSADQAGDFDTWFRHSAAYNEDPQALWHDGSVYPQRAQFGAWVEEKFRQAAGASAVKLTHIRGKAVAFEKGSVITSAGQRFPADDIVLAISHPPPALPSLLQAYSGDEAVITNPWQANVLTRVKPDDRVAIIGTGLTMSDVVASLHRQQHRGDIVAFSRRGLLPRPNLSGKYPVVSLDDHYLQAATARGWLRRIREEIKLAAEQGLPWQLILDAIRSNGQRVWQQLSLKEKQRFLRSLRPWWDVHRYRIAPQINNVLTEWQSSGQLTVKAARLIHVATTPSPLTLTIQLRGASCESLTVDKVIVTTGPAHGALLSSDAFLNQLMTAGVICADELGLGIRVNDRSQALDSAGKANPHIYVAGPAARGHFGELMGLPQVADHAEQVALQLLSDTEHTLSERCRASTNTQ